MGLLFSSGIDYEVPKYGFDRRRKFMSVGVVAEYKIDDLRWCNES